MDSTQVILYYIQHLAILSNRQSDQVLQEQLGIGMSQYRILQVLQTNSDIQQKQVASLLGQTEASISRQVKLMQSKAMLSAEINPKNRREHITKLLPKGERLLEAATQVLAQYHLPAIKSLSSKEQMQLIKLLTRVHEHVCNVDDVAGIMHYGVDNVRTV